MENENERIERLAEAEAMAENARIELQSGKYDADQRRQDAEMEEAARDRMQAANVLEAFRPLGELARFYDPQI